MGAIVVYTSQYGSTKRYAEWIASSLGCKAYESTGVDATTLKNANIVVYGGGLYAGSIKGVHWIKKNWNQLQNKQLYVYTVGLSDPTNDELLQGIRNNNFTAEQRAHIHFYAFRGGIDYSKLNFVHRLMMSMVNWFMGRKLKAKATPESEKERQNLGKSVDLTNRNAIVPMVDAIKKQK